jgi:ComF family protein
LWGFLLEALYPPSIYCMACGNLTDASRPYSLCDKCVKAFKWATGGTCEKCGKALRGTGGLCADCAEVAHVFAKGFSCVEYNGCKEMIHAFKYKDRPYYAESLAQIMADRVGGEAPGVDLVTPVPMFHRKERRRGYNQADLLGKLFAVKLGITYEKNLLVRVRDTGAMSGIGAAADRADNVRGAFKASPGGAAAGKTVMLVDDIYTTGSTVDACSLALMDAGARAVFFIALASSADA